ncbi:hypothetical protein MKW94_006469, partial [Papaver nudicaule]|nr:hypothetical protein [Papaver nudicaule]
QTDEGSKNRVGGVYDRNKCYNSAFWRLLKAYKFEVLCEMIRVRDAIPRGIQELLNYDIDWAVSDKVDSQNTLRRWISSEIREFVKSQKSAATLVDSI